MEWIKRQSNLEIEDLKELAKKYNISLLKAGFLARRGIEEKDFLYFLEHDIEKTHNPYLFKEMEKFVDRLFDAKSEGEKVLIFGDRDADGITATSLMYNYLNREGFNIDYKLPLGDETYGLTMQAVDDFYEQGGTLLITIDCGTSNILEIEHANELGIDCLILDHHNIKDDLIPPAYAFINPKLPDSNYPFKGICSGVLASKAILALEFSKTDFYKENISFLYIKAFDDNKIECEILNTRNMVIRDSKIELLNFDKRFSYTDFFKLFDSKIIYLYSLKQKEKLIIESIFSNNTSFFLKDLKEEVGSYYPVLSKMTIDDIRMKSTYFKYNAHIKNADILFYLFETVVNKSTNYKAYYKSILDIAAISTLSDMMPLIDENRFIVRYGLSNLLNTTNYGLRSLLDKRKIQGDINENTITFKITPLINSTGRMGRPNLAVKLLSSHSEAPEILKEVLKLDEQRRRLSKNAWDLILNDAFVSYKENEKKLISIISQDINRGIVSMLAIRILQKFKTPTMIVAKVGEKLIGSIRTYKNASFKATEFLSNFHDIFTDWGGHDMAGGFNLEFEKSQEFQVRIKEVLKDLNDTDNRDDINYYDIKIDEPYIYKYYSDFINLYKDFFPYGKGFEPIVFKYENAKITFVDYIGKNVKGIKLTFKFANQFLSGALWDCEQEYKSGEIVNLYFSLGKDLYKSNIKTPILNILDIEKIKI